MDIAMWILAGAILGWVGCTRFGYNEGRGSAVSAVIGGVGGVVGGNLVAPMLLAAPAAAGGFSVGALVIAGFVAAGFLLAGNLVYNRWGV